VLLIFRWPMEAFLRRRGGFKTLSSVLSLRDSRHQAWGDVLCLPPFPSVALVFTRACDAGLHSGSSFSFLCRDPAQNGRRNLFSVLLSRRGDTTALVCLFVMKLSTPLSFFAVGWIVLCLHPR